MKRILFLLIAGTIILAVVAACAPAKPEAVPQTPRSGSGAIRGVEFR